MLTKLQRRNSQGFTIIEVMIVLAIAALILLIVLLAVPALQRNSRNTAIKNDASAVVAAVGEFASNNDGSTPDTITQADSKVTLSKAGDTSSEAKVQTNTTVDTAAPDDTTAGHIWVAFGQKCNDDNSHTLTASARSTAVMYNIETSSVPAPRCTDS